MRISEYQVSGNQLNFLLCEMEEQPKLIFRPGVHPALIVPHVFPNHIATVNAFTRHNIIQPDEEEDDATSLEAAAEKSSIEDAALNKDDLSMGTATTCLSNDTNSEEDGTTLSTVDDSLTPTDLLEVYDGGELDTADADAVKAAGVSSRYDPSNDDTDATTTIRSMSTQWRAMKRAPWPAWTARIPYRNPCSIPMKNIQRESKRINLLLSRPIQP